MRRVAKIFRNWQKSTHLLVGKLNWAEHGDLTFQSQTTTRLPPGFRKREYKVPFRSHIDVYEGSSELWDRAMHVSKQDEEYAKYLLWCYFVLATLNAMDVFRGRVSKDQKIGAMKTLLVKSSKDF